MPAPLGGLADRGADGRGLETVQRGFEPVVVTQGRTAANEAQDFVRGGGHQPRRAQSSIARLYDLARGPDEDVGVPYRRHAVIGHRLDTDRDIAGNEIDRRDAMGLRERKERIGHEILRVSGCEVTGERPEQIELSALRVGSMPRRHSKADQRA